MIADALTGTSAAALGRRYRRHVAASTAQRPKLSFPFIGAEAGYASNARIRLADGPRPLRSGTGGVVLSHRGTDYTIVPELEPVLSALVGGEPVTYGDLEAAAGADAPLAAGFVTEMLARGVFVVSPEPDA